MKNVAAIKVKFLAAALSLALLCIFIAPKAHASTSDFIINNFDADYTLTKKDPQGELHIVERIKLNFKDNNHGILRAIPNSYKKHRLQLVINSVTSDTGAPSKYTTYTQNDNTVLKIGDPNKTVTGAQEYTIDYTLRNVISFYKDHDELYWDINGGQWEQYINNVTVTLHLPSNMPLPPTASNCYVGSYGSNSQKCSISYSQNKQSIDASTLSGLGPAQTLTVAVGFKKGYFSPSKWYETFGEYGASVVGFLVSLLVVALPALIYWYRRGRDPKGRGVIVPEYEAPDKLKPIEVGTITDFTTDNKDLTATIIDLAIRGYIRIIENKKDRLVGSKTSYSLKLLKSSKTGLDDYEKAVIDGIFGNGHTGEEVSLEDLKFKLEKTATQLRKDLKASMLERGYFQRHPITVSIVLAAIATIALWLALFITIITRYDEIAIAATIVGTAIGVTLAIVAIIFARSRTIKGAIAKEHIMGLRLYIKTAEADRIKMLQSPNARYAPKTKAPSMTVDLFEKLLPYAMVLGVEGEWAKKFEHIYRTPPDWYSGNWTTFSTIYLISSLNHGMASAVNTAFSAPSNASGSGVGGGFAGGGGGGGGGGGW